MPRTKAYNPLTQRYEPGQLALPDLGECPACREKQRRIEELEAQLATLVVTDRQRRLEKERKVERALFRWRRFHFVDNPWVWDAMVLALQKAHHQRRTHYGIAAISEQLRYESGRLARPVDDFDFSAEHGTIYGRMVAYTHPELAYLLGLRSSDYDHATPWLDPWTAEDEAKWQAEGGKG